MLKAKKVNVIILKRKAYKNNRLQNYYMNFTIKLQKQYFIVYLNLL